MSACFFIFLWFQMYDFRLFDITLFVCDKFGYCCLIDSWIVSKYSNCFFLSIICFTDSRPLWPWIIFCPLIWKFWHHF